MRGASKTITIIILVVLFVVLAALAIIVFLNLRGGGSTIAVPGESCSQGASAQCLVNASGNTGFLCNCTNQGGSYKWDCATENKLICPPAGSGNTCNQGETQTGGCGTSGCQAGERPVQQCGADGKYGQITCSTDATCQQTTTSSGTVSSTAGCIITNPDVKDSYISIGTDCPTDFPYKIEKHALAVAPNSNSTSCVGTTVASPVTRLVKVGDRIDFATESCGQCVEYRLVDFPSSVTAPVGGFTVAAYTGNCALSSTSSAATSVVSSANSSTGSLPQTGIFDDVEYRPLLLGGLLILIGILINRVFIFYNVYTNHKEHTRFEDHTLNKLKRKQS